MSRSALDQQLQLAMQLHQSGRLPDARAAYERILLQFPNDPEALHYLGVLISQMGHPGRGVELIEKAISIRPEAAMYHNNLGTALKNMGRVKRAINAYRRSIEINAQDPLPHCNLGDALRDAGKLQEAADACRRALQLKPDYAEAYCNLGLALNASHHYEEAAVAFKMAISLKPGLTEAAHGLGYGLAYQGLIVDAVECFSKSVERDRDGALLFFAQYHPDFTLRQHFEMARDWAGRHVPLLDARRKFSNDPTPDRKLKIGYVSPDFRYHPVGRFFQPILENHDRRQFDVHCFSNVRRPDEFTEQLKDACEHWHEIVELSDTEAAELIRNEQIDILIDLALHSGFNRLEVFGKKPAPVQATYLAYCATSGLSMMDYVLCDKWLIPQGANENYFVERIARLANSYWCYRASVDSPDPAPLSALEKRYITFGCLNQGAKLSRSAVGAWCQLLSQVPRSRLVLHCQHAVHRARLGERFDREGIEASRIQFNGQKPFADYLRSYHEIDIALDPFPFAGGTTTCDALWMGVPVVTLAGDTPVSRSGVSILHNMGLEKLVADSVPRYIQIASSLAADLPGLKQMRVGLRDHMRRSPLMNEPQCTVDLENVLREIWIKWCEGR